MRMLAESWSLEEISQAPLDQLAWYHLITLQTKLSTKKERQQYAALTARNGWSRNVLVHQIELGTASRIGAAQNNFAITLAPPQSDLARETLKDPYKLEFLELATDIRERELEQALVSRLSDFLLELGTGFAFVGKQVHLNVGGEDFYIDLLFYHIRLHCYVVIELKTTDFNLSISGNWASISPLLTNKCAPYRMPRPSGSSSARTRTGSWQNMPCEMPTAPSVYPSTSSPLLSPTNGKAACPA